MKTLKGAKTSLVKIDISVLIVQRQTRLRIRLVSMLALPALLCCLAARASGEITNGGALRASASVHGSLYDIGNEIVAASFVLRNGQLTGLRVEDKSHHRQIELEDPFTLGAEGGIILRGSEMPVAGAPVIEGLEPAGSATRAAEHEAGKSICIDFSNEKLGGRIEWCLVLRDGSRYLRETLTIHAGDDSIPIENINLLHFRDAEAHVSGAVPGSPVVDRTTFFGFEHPLSKSAVSQGEVELSLKRVLPLQPHQAITYSAVIGISEPGGMRRSFLSYIERERVHPYRTFLTYNSWYDLGYGERYDEAGAIDRVHAFGEELKRKRGVTLDSFLFDDGWDNADSLWQFDAGFPNGFTRVAQTASAYGAGIGVWLSPWGGYAQAKKTRIAYGRQHGYEIVKDGYALSGPRYYQAFEQTCLAMIDKFRVNQFKFDGTGNANQVFAGSAYDSDFDAAIHLIDRLRQQGASIFINLTTGTYPSPFWLKYADSIWRGGEDHDFAGVGSWRQKWITYRDAQTYKNIVRAGPLFPLNSLMLHGIIYAREAEHLGDTSKGEDAGPENEKDFADEVWSLFGTGTDMQELYITPSLLSQQDWDVLAAAARWSRANSDVLRDTHWIGGDPGALQVYGWAAWAPHKGIVVLRNPSDQAQTFTLDAGAAFELTSDRLHRFQLMNARGAGSKLPGLPNVLSTGVPQQITLAPFQVVAMELLPES